MKKRIFTLLLAAVLTLSLVTPGAFADARYFSDVDPNAWYADSVLWAANRGIVKGYADGSFGVGRPCTSMESIIMLWRAAGSVDVGVGKTDGEKALAWLERQSSLPLDFAQGTSLLTRINYVLLLYVALGDMATPKAELTFTDLDGLGENSDVYLRALEWAVAKGVANGVSPTQFAPSQVMTREQVATVLRRAFEKELPYTVEKKTVPMYIASPAAQMPLELCFIDGQDDIPYISVETAKELLTTFYQSFAAIKGADTASELELTKTGERVTFLRDGSFPMYLDFDTDQISFIDYDAILRKTAKEPILSLLSATGFDEEGKPAYYKFLDTGSERYGKAFTMELGAYGLRLIHQDDGYYLPLQTFNDVFLALLVGTNILYNGEAAFVNPGEELEKMYYGVQAGPRSPALAMFTYKELCFALDHLYGLKQQHDITSFHEQFKMTGLMGDLLSSDPAVADAALWKLTAYYLDDSHTGFTNPSYLEGAKVGWDMTPGFSMALMRETRSRLLETRQAAFPNGVPLYQEVGDTAYITFDSFVNRTADYYQTAPTADAPDTIGQMLYAYAQITREGSPVKNVVMDLSLNGGGTIDAAVFSIGLFLGKSSVSVHNTLTGAQVTQNNLVDLNLDRVFDEKDSLQGYNLYCLISPGSFSCGNLVPCVFKSSHRVTLLGQTSGGGACSVLHLSTADGARFQMSSPLCLSFLKNGSFYDIDQGAAPDHVINDYAKFYDRAALTDYIHSLY